MTECDIKFLKHCGYNDKEIAEWNEDSWDYENEGSYKLWKAGYDEASKELQEENDKLKKECLEVYKEWRQMDKEKQKLEKENTELKGLKDVATLIRANNDTVVTLMQLNNMLVSKSQQLSKAKEIIKELLLSDTRKGSDWTGYLIDLKERAEQFLKDSEVKYD